ncbi:hypothetical protein [Methylobacter sp. BlB1]|uniref:hypothetical protein n=1 Tax=Methylobacter sp. BlB1 TaxID=2785914 RepID=UPI0018933BFA|nr:hypothetical protein [Methylobacter sp. BlB1]MBF6651231.1 hypothetical protein [Methylobacter sp. BlB1]
MLAIPFDLAKKYETLLIKGVPSAFLTIMIYTHTVQRVTIKQTKNPLDFELY